MKESTTSKIEAQLRKPVTVLGLELCSHSQCMLLESMHKIIDFIPSLCGPSLPGQPTLLCYKSNSDLLILINCEIYSSVNHVIYRTRYIPNMKSVLSIYPQSKHDDDS